MARTTVTTAGRPSGMAETARETATINISRIGIPLKIPIPNIMIQAPIANRLKYFPRPESFSCRGV